MNQSSLKRKIQKAIILSSLLITSLNGIVFATSAEIDVTPPMGKVVIQNATVINNINYVDSAEIEVMVDAKDDMCDLEEIKYYISTSPISREEELPDATEENPNGWKSYTPGKIEKMTLPDLTTTNKIYSYFKDPTGNTSLIYSGTNVTYEIVYNKNAEDAEMFTSTVATTAYHGMPFMVTMQAPTRDGYYFAGWSTSPNSTTASYKKGELIPADVFKGGASTINLYAVWSQSSNGLVMLSDVVEIGDYVNYPVTYENVFSNNAGTGYKSPYHGWRVISKDVDLDGNESIGTVNLVSAGTPLRFKNNNNSTTSIAALTTNFLTTPINNGENFAYQNSGFVLYKSLTETFTNKFTAMKSDGVTPQVRAMMAEDIYRITGHTAMSGGTAMDLANNKYEELFKNGADYYLASASNSGYLWRVYSDGNVNSYGSDSLGIRPVVSLKSNIVATGVDRIGAWNIEIAQ